MTRVAPRSNDNAPPVPFDRSAGTLAGSILAASHDCIKVLSTDGKLLFMNDNGMCAMEIANFEPFEGADWASFWPEQTRPKVHLAMESALAGAFGRFQGFCPTAMGSPAWWDVVVTPMFGEVGGVQGLLAVSRNITALREMPA